MPFNRGDIYQVNFDPREEDEELAGSEMRKERPAVVVSVNQIGRPRLAIVVPLTTKGGRYRKAEWMVPIQKTDENGLRELSWADASQVKSVSEQRFGDKLGRIARPRLNEIVAMIAHCVGYRPSRLT
ncbi:MAG: type II toxin-antitoxin system PemK/MazF family toxin [Anaerolineaceae bacterium]|nr:type II toxin-antitoxin system PemK/MazF family toxin [Anaerolineaceae bacterium]